MGGVVSGRSASALAAHRTGFLAALTSAELEDLEGRARPRRFAKGSTLVSEGEIPRRVVILRGGRVKVSHFAEDGREVVLTARGPGELIGEISVVDGRPCSATVTAFEPVEALVVEAEAFTRYLDEHPRVTRMLLSETVQKLRDSDRKRVEFGIHDTEGRVARRLVELAEAYGEEAERGVSITLPLTQQELAGWTSASREAVSKALGSLRACGWVSTDRRRVTVLDLEALRRRASRF
jgi:CRP/FNR family transcriptional regulator, cyclic AMP receptor protein